MFFFLRKPSTAFHKKNTCSENRTLGFIGRGAISQMETCCKIAKDCKLGIVNHNGFVSSINLFEGVKDILYRVYKDRSAHSVDFKLTS